MIRITRIKKTPYYIDRVVLRQKRKYRGKELIKIFNQQLNSKNIQIKQKLNYEEI